jgi:hypothetical protein
MSAAKASLTTAVAVGAGLFIASLTAGTVAQSADPFLGKWTLNLAKSKYNPGPPPKGSIATFTAAGADRVRVVVEGVASTGDKVRWEYTAAHDGKSYPATGNPDADLVSLKRINARSVEVTSRKGGKVTLVNTRTVSTDGRTMTVTTKGTTARGQVVNNVQVYDKT